MHRLSAICASPALAGCASAGAGDADALRRLLDDRRAHLETDADLIAGHLADSLISVSNGQVTVESRDQARSFFRAYFAGRIGIPKRIGILNTVLHSRTLYPPPVISSIA